MKGFFSSADVLSTRVALPTLPQCGVCGLHKKCISPKMPVSGKGKSEIMIVGEAPGKTEDERNRPFIGESGQILEGTLRKLGVEMRHDCWITNALRCRPPNNVIRDKRSIDYCRPYLMEAIREHNPRIIILLGATAVQSLLGWLWKEDVGGITRWVGWRIPNQRLNAWICPTFHPAFLLRNQQMKGPDISAMYFEEHLRRAVNLKDRPFEEVPDFGKSINIVLDCKHAASLITAMKERGSPVAWDIETDRLKPDHKRSTIISCAVSDGKETVSYPWHGRAIQATLDLLRSDVPKWGWNLKFESRWLLARYGCRIRNFDWDGMLAAHTLDNRKHICSLKFQAFVMLGQESYDDDIKPYLKASGNNIENRIKEVGLNKLLVYNGTDALLTWKLAKIQRRLLGVDK